MNKTRGVVHINMDGWRKIEKNGATTLYTIRTQIHKKYVSFI